MYLKWNQYRQTREEAGFNQKIDKLCETIAVSGLTFGQWWLGAGLPALIEGNYDSAEQLLVEAWYNPLSWGRGQGTGMDPVGPGNSGGVMQNPPSDAGPDLARKDISPDVQAKIKASAAKIKQELGRALHGVVSQMKQNRDSVGYQVANILLQRLDGQVDQITGQLKRGQGKFDRNAAFGPSPATQGRDARWQQMMSTPEGIERVTQHFARQLGVDPAEIRKLWNQGIKDPQQWVSYLKPNGLGASQDVNDPEAQRYKQRLAQMAGSGGSTVPGPQTNRASTVAAMRKMMRKFMAK